MAGLRIYGIARTRAFRALWVAMELGIESSTSRSKSARLAPGRRNSWRSIPTAGCRRSMMTASSCGSRLRSRSNKRRSIRRGGRYPGKSEGEAKTWQWSLWALNEVDREVNNWSLIRSACRPKIATG